MREPKPPGTVQVDVGVKTATLSPDGSPGRYPTIVAWGRFAERMLRVVATCRRRKRSVLEDLNVVTSNEPAWPSRSGISPP